MQASLHLLDVIAAYIAAVNAKYGATSAGIR